MKLSGNQKEALHEALLSAFRDTNSLKRMVSFGLNENLDAIAGAGKLEDVIFELIEWADRHGRVEDLLEAARKANSSNRNLSEFIKSLERPSDQEKPSAARDAGTLEPKEVSTRRPRITTPDEISEDTAPGDDGKKSKRLISVVILIVALIGVLLIILGRGGVKGPNPTPVPSSSTIIENTQPKMVTVTPTYATLTPTDTPTQTHTPTPTYTSTPTYTPHPLFCAEFDNMIDDEDWTWDAQIATPSAGRLYFPPVQHENDEQYISRDYGGLQFSAIEFQGQVDGGSKGRIGLQTRCGTDQPGIHILILALDEDQGIIGEVDGSPPVWSEKMNFKQNYVIRLEENENNISVFIDGELVITPYPCDWMGDWLKMGALILGGQTVEGHIDRLCVWQ